MEQQLTVEQLIKKLQDCDPAALVWVEGCDCCGEAKDVKPHPTDGTVMITRYR